MVDFEGRSAACNFFVVRQGGSLSGRDSLERLGVQIDCAQHQCRVNRIDRGNVEEAFRDVVENRLGKITGFEHSVKEKKGVVPVQQRIRRLPFTVREQVFKEIKTLEAADVVEQVEASESISAMVVVAKKDGRVRLCVDLRTVNKAIMADVFPLPHFEDLLTKLGVAPVHGLIENTVL